MPLQTTRVIRGVDNLLVKLNPSDAYPLAVYPANGSALTSPDRYTPLTVAALEPNTNQDLIVDLSTNVNVYAIGLLGLNVSGVGPYQLSFDSATNAGYPSGTYTSRSGLISLADDVRDVIVALPAVASMRYLRCALYAGGDGCDSFTVSKMFACSSAKYANLGVVYAPDSKESTVSQRSRVRLLDGHEVVTEYGPSRRQFVMQFPNSSSARRDTIRAVATDLLPFVLHAPSGEAFECRAIEDTFTSEAVWGVVGSTTSDLWNCTLEVESLP